MQSMTDVSGTHFSSPLNGRIVEHAGGSTTHTTASLSDKNQTDSQPSLRASKHTSFLPSSLRQRRAEVVRAAANLVAAVLPIPLTAGGKPWPRKQRVALSRLVTAVGAYHSDFAAWEPPVQPRPQLQPQPQPQPLPLPQPLHQQHLLQALPAPTHTRDEPSVVPTHREDTAIATGSTDAACVPPRTTTGKDVFTAKERLRRLLHSMPTEPMQQWVGNRRLHGTAALTFEEVLEVLKCHGL